MAWLAGAAYGCQGAPALIGGSDEGASVDARVIGPPPDPLGDPVWPAAEPLPEEFDFPPFVTMPALNRMVIGFRTVEAQAARVHFGKDDSYGTTVMATTEDGMLFRADLGELDEATAYYYEVEIDETSTRRRGVFLTSGKSSWRFIQLAEFHAPSQSENVAEFADAISAFRPHVIIESGDMLDNGGSMTHWRSYFRTSAPWISNAIILPIGSNHVAGLGGNSFIRYFFELPNNERWYSTRYSNARIYSLDSTAGPSQPDIELVEPDWLATTLRNNLGSQDFVIGTWHYPACSTLQASRSGSREWVMDHFVNTFLLNGGVDLILTGHDKYYERSLIDDHIPHLTTNTGKLSPAAAGGNHVRCRPIVTSATTTSLLFGHANASELRLFAVSPDGTEIDRFSVPAR